MNEVDRNIGTSCEFIYFYKIVTLTSIVMSENPRWLIIAVPKRYLDLLTNFQLVKNKYPSVTSNLFYRVDL